MKIYKTTEGIILLVEGQWFKAPHSDWDEFVNRDNLHEAIHLEVNHFAKLWEEDVVAIESKILPPIGSQEVWAAGVTYLRSKEARMEESKRSGADVFYDKVYSAERPELFFKSTANKVVGTNESVKVRKDSEWNVPEPELTLFISSSGNIQGYTIGNDMSSRSIEGQNPLYLPQAKVYDCSAALGPCLYVPKGRISKSTSIEIEILRAGFSVYEGQTTLNQMKRSLEELVHFLFRDSTFNEGVYLMTGTCLVPGNEFTLQPNDIVAISIDNIGTLVNTVA